MSAWKVNSYKTICILKNLTLGTVPIAWSKCESIFCVDPGQIGMSILRGSMNNVCSLHEKAIAYVNPGVGGWRTTSCSLLSKGDRLCRCGRSMNNILQSTWRDDHPCQSWEGGSLNNIMQSVWRDNCLFAWRGDHLCRSWGGGVNIRHGEDQQSAFYCPHGLSIADHRSWREGGWELCSRTISM